MPLNRHEIKCLWKCLIFVVSLISPWKLPLSFSSSSCSSESATKLQKDFYCCKIAVLCKEGWGETSLSYYTNLILSSSGILNTYICIIFQDCPWKRQFLRGNQNQLWQQHLFLEDRGKTPEANSVIIPVAALLTFFLSALLEK